MTARGGESLDITEEQSIVLVRRLVREWTRRIGFSLVDQTKLVTAASELARNCLVHGGGGVCRVEQVAHGGRQGIRLTFEDQGPGIADVEQALQDGYTTTAGLGLGLGGTRRLVHEFDVETKSRGTTITVVRWH